MGQGKPKEAIAELREVVRLQPANVDALTQLSNILRERAELEKTLTALRVRVRANPDSVKDHAYVGMTLDSLARYEEAIVEHREALRLQPDAAHAHNNLAWALALSSSRRPGDIDEALRRIRRAIELEPKYGGFHGTLGTVEYRAGHWEKAVAAFRISIKRQKGGDAYDHFFLAMAQWHLGRKDDARSWFDKGVAWTLANRPGDILLLNFWAEAAELLGRQGPDRGHPNDARPGGPKPPE